MTKTTKRMTIRETLDRHAAVRAELTKQHRSMEAKAGDKGWAVVRLRSDAIGAGGIPVRKAGDFVFATWSPVAAGWRLYDADSCVMNEPDVEVFEPTWYREFHFAMGTLVVLGAKGPGWFFFNQDHPAAIQQSELLALRDFLNDRFPVEARLP